MEICITGVSGFVGRFLSGFLVKKGHRVTGVDRNPPGSFSDSPFFRFIEADTTVKGDWLDHIGRAEAVVNLTGVNIFARWTENRKAVIYKSRILSTRNVASAVSPGAVLLSTSAAGIYGNRGDEVLTESALPGDDFLAKVCVDWEAEAGRAAEKGARVAIARLGVVLGRDGGALAKMATPFRLFLGGPLGDGRHWMPWIHLIDLARAMEFLILNHKLSGPFNCCAPGQATNREFVCALGSALRRPAVFPMPAFFLKLLLGELGGFLLYSQRVVPERLLDAGFEFSFPEIRSAMADIYS